MNEDFVSFSLAKKLKEKGFVCKYPFAMYNEIGTFHSLYTSCDETLVNCVFGNRGYYDYDDFDENDCVCPTISQVLKWLREEKNLCVEVLISVRGGWYNIIYEIAPRRGFDLKHMLIEEKSYEDAAIAGIEYCLDNLI